MIKLIAAIDSVRGIAKEGSAPWGSPAYSAYYKKKTSSGLILSDESGRMTLSKALGGDLELKTDVDTFLQQRRNVWLVGSSELYNTAINYADELYITQLNGVFGFDEEFPSFENDFVLYSKSKIKRHNGTEYQHQVWKRKSIYLHEDEYSV